LRKRNTHFITDKLNAGEALNLAHFLAFAPYAFEAARIMRDRGVLALLEECREEGSTAEAIAASLQLQPNAAVALLEAGLGIGLVSADRDRFYLTMAGQYFLHDTTVRTNTDFMRDVCLPGMTSLEHSMEQGRPIGLEAFGHWANIFEALPALPASARQSWYAFNNHHSDAAFGDALPQVFAHHPARILDIGGSTGRFALACLDYSDSIHIGVADLSTHAEQTEPGIAAAVRAGRVTLHALDILDTANEVPAGYDTIWMSQFMPCFSEEQVVAILARCHDVLPPNGRIWLLETFWDRQRHEAAATALQMTSLYFVNVATGVSRMWDSKHLQRLIEAAGFTIVMQKDGVGRGHSLLELRKS
jgi:SAM-dependent methyltransferase